MYSDSDTNVLGVCVWLD